MNESRKDLLDRLKVDKVPVVSTPNQINYDFAQSVTERKEQRKKQQTRYTAQNGTLNKAKKKGISLTAVALVSGLLAMGTIVALPKVKEWKEEQKEIARQEQILHEIEEVSKEYNKIEDITLALQDAKTHYAKGLNANFEPITEENMSEELLNIKELIKSAYKLRIGEAYGVKPEDASKIIGKEESILNTNDKHMHVIIPEEISPTGERIDLWDGEVPKEIAGLIRIAGSINPNLDFEYNDSNIIWGRALAGLDLATENSKVKYDFDGKNIKEENQKNNDGFEIGE